MRLHPNPFEMIKGGTKTIEIRLNDEKRKSIKVGDLIKFISRENPEEAFQVEVVRLDVFDSFKDAYAAYSPKEYGGESKEEWKGMYIYYSPDEEKKHGVLGIHLSP